MAKKLDLYLVRHGESLGNVNKDVHITTADHAIALSDKGIEQAYQAGLDLGPKLLAAIEEEIKEAVSTGIEEALAITQIKPVRIWASPYKRTRQTAEHLQRGIEASLANVAHPYKDKLVFDYKEHINLVEQQFGMFDGIDDKDLQVKFPNEYAHYKKQEDFEGKFWAQMPLGESRFAVALRVHQAFGTFHRDFEEHGLNKLIIVSHGVTLRTLTMQWLHLPYEWVDKELNPNNCSIRLIKGQKDHGYIFPGFIKDRHATKDAPV